MEVPRYRSRATHRPDFGNLLPDQNTDGGMVRGATRIRRKSGGRFNEDAIPSAGWPTRGEDPVYQTQRSSLCADPGTLQRPIRRQRI